QPGGGWTTNSRSRAQGEKQVDLVDGAMHITRAAVADHGVSVVHDLKFKDVTIRMRFKIRDQDELGINIADMNEKSVHAGHICVAKIRTQKVEIMDLKTGNMDLKIRRLRQAGTVDEATNQMLATKRKRFDVATEADRWHQLEVKIAGDVMSIRIDGRDVGSFASPGINHGTKSRIRLAVAKQAWVDDVMVWAQ
ncbi:MAG: family 16 glycoside hydrolase, partial [Planctomycetota bacterium]